MKLKKGKVFFNFTSSIMSSKIKRLAILAIMIILFLGMTSLTGSKFKGEILDKYIFAIYYYCHPTSVETDYSINMGEFGSKEWERNMQEIYEITDLVAETVFLGKKLHEIGPKYNRYHLVSFTAVIMDLKNTGEKD